MNPQPSELASAAPSLPQLEPLEIHSGMITGLRRGPAPTAEPDLRGTARETLERLILPALSRTPCRVAFSGGRDSSAILALATDLARRNDLPRPVPLTLRYEGHPRTWETEWQESMVRHLEIDEWEIIEIRAELDVLGPTARDTLLRNGLFWPPNAHTAIPLLRAARGGSLLTGNGGDEAFQSLVEAKKMSWSQMWSSLPPHRAVMVALISSLPFRWKTRVQYKHGLRFPWLRPAARREVQRRFVADLAERQAGSRQRIERLDGSRYLELFRGTMSALNHEAEVELVEPFLDSGFLRALASQPVEMAFRSRNEALESLFDNLLPPSIAGRTSKAVFTETFWGPDSDRFAEEWDCKGLDSSLIDPRALRDHWRRPRPDLRSATPMQAAWLASRDRS